MLKPWLFTTVNKIILFMLGFIISGCAALPSHFELAVVDQTLAFPPPPETTRLVYKGTVIGESNLVKSRRTITTSQKILRALVGLSRNSESPDNLLRPISITGWLGESLFIVDAGNSSILKLDRFLGEMELITNAGKNTSFVSPVSIAKLGDDAVVVSDSAIGKVVILSRDGNWEKDIGSGLLERPVGIAVDPETLDIYVADSKADNIKVFSSEGLLIDVIGASGVGPGQFNGPTHLAIKYPWLAVSDTLNGRVQLIDLETGESRIIGRRGLFVGNFVRPKGLAFDSDFNLYALESYYDHLLIFNIDGEFLMSLGGNGQQHGQFNLPSGLYIDENDTIYITDMLNGRVEVFQYLGE